jgi:uncharacterized membrane protein
MMRTDPRDDPINIGRREWSMETAVGIVLIVIAALEMVFIIRTVQSNTGRP